MNDPAFWLAFSLVTGIGPRRILKLLEHFGSLETAWQANPQELRRAGLEDALVTKLVEQRRNLDLTVELRRVEKVDAWLLTLMDERYPALLRALDDAPPVLYVRGSITPADSLALAVVGTRKASKYGHDAAAELSREAARHGVTIVSGLAHGIDAAAHQGAIDGGGRTLAVMGTGIDICYPQNHRELAYRIIANGAVISEFPIGTRPLAANFPRRNRVVSGLTLGVLVVEAPEGSGALITASLAAEQGREVFAVPGNIFNPTSRGTNHLIQDGAKLVQGIEDILSEIDIAYENVQTKVSAEEIAPSSDTEAYILQHLNADPIHIDEIARLSGLPIADVSSTLTILELKGLAQSVGPMQYSRVQQH